LVSTKSSILYYYNTAMKRHKYEYDLNVASFSAPAAVVRMVGRGKQVLEIGAGPGSITRILKEHNDCRVTAVEIDEEAIKKLSPFCEQVYRCDLNDQTWTSVLPKNSKFEVLVAADVLEHLHDPHSTLNTVKNILDTDGAVVVSLPHIGHSAAIGCLSRNDFEMQDWGLLDKTHIQLFNIYNMQRLFDDTGFKIIEAEFIVLPPEQTELAYFWRRIPKKIKDDLRKNRFGNVYQVVIKATPYLSSQQGLVLPSLPVPSPESTSSGNTTPRTKVIHLIKENILPYLHPRTRLRIRDFLYMIGLRF
jgi:2-polyprenyl-3-methyl-5-hydroxy-6-metoxy-1,4-benzoquinol methylase